VYSPLITILTHLPCVLLLTRPYGQIWSRFSVSPSPQWDEGDLQIELCIESMQDDDYWTMKNLLRGYLQESPFNSSELVDLVLSQKEKIGSSVTVVGQEEMFGFMSVVDASEHWEKPCVQSVLKYVLGRVGTSSQFEDWKKILSKKDSRIGIVLSERIANLPDHLAPHLNILTLNELMHMDPSPQYQYLLLITTTYKQGVEDAGEEGATLVDIDGGDEDGEEGAGRKKKKQQQHHAAGMMRKHSDAQPSLDPTVHYFKIEDEVYKECALLTHSTRIIKYNQQNRWTLRMYTQPSKLFLLISADQIPRIIAKFKQMASIGDAEAKKTITSSSSSSASSSKTGK